MNAKATWLLVLLASVVSIFILFVEHPARQARQTSPHNRLFHDLDPAKVTAIYVLPAGKLEIAAEKTEQRWELRKPITYPANVEFVEALLTNLAALTWHTHITAAELKDRPGANEELGINEPQFALKIQSGEVQQQLLVGRKGVIGNEVFVKFVGGDAVFLVDATWLNLLPRRPEDWRDPALFPTGLSEITGIEVRAGNKGVKLELNPTNHLWRMTRPIEARASQKIMATLLSNLAEVQITAYVEEDPNIDLDRFGLPSNPAQAPQLELSLLHGTNIVQGVQVGDTLTNATEYAFAKHLDRNAVFVIPKNALAPWLSSHNEFRDRHLVRFSTNQIAGIQVINSEPFSLRHDGTRWMLALENSFSPDPEAVADIVAVLTAVEFEFENDVVTDFSPYGLAKPLLELTVSGTVTNMLSGAKEIATEQLQFGTNGSNKIFVRRNEESRVYSIHPQEFALIPRSAWQLRDKQVWDFNVTNVVSVTIEQHGKTRKLLRNGANEWSIASGSQGIINPFVLEEAMHRLGQLKAVFWTARGELKGDPYGFSKNDLRLWIELSRNGKSELLQMAFGDFSEFKLPYAKTSVDGQNTVFEFPLPLYLEFIRRDLSIVPGPLPPL